MNFVYLCPAMRKILFTSPLIIAMMVVLLHNAFPHHHHETGLMHYYHGTDDHDPCDDHHQKKCLIQDIDLGVPKSHGIVKSSQDNDFHALQAINDPHDLVSYGKRLVFSGLSDQLPLDIRVINLPPRAPPV